MRILKFEGPNCVYCKKLDKILDMLHIEVEHINVQDNLDLARRYNVSTLPTLVKLADDNKVAILPGMQDINKLKEFLNG